MQRFTFISVFLLIIIPFSSMRADIIYVDVDASGAEDGTTWTDAFKDILTANQSSSDGDEIWIAEGTYFTSEIVYLNCQHNIKFFGGFEGNETLRSQRSPSDHPTIYSAELGDPNNIEDNRNHHFYFEVNTPGTAVVIDGLILEDSYGASISLSYTLSESDLQVKVRNCIFRNNHLRISATYYKLNFENCIFHDNVTSTSMIRFNDKNGTSDIQSSILNCTFYNNVSLSIIESTIDQDNPILIANSIFRNNTNTFDEIKYLDYADNMDAISIRYCIVNTFDSRIADTTNLYRFAPDFTAPNFGDFSLKQCSNAIDRGVDSVFSYAFDIDLNDRISGDAMDLGAHEYQQGSGSVIYVKAGALGANTGTNWGTAFSDLQDALAIAEFGNQIWVAEGDYMPTSGMDPVASFDIPCGVEVYGGFDGSEGLLDQRDWENNITTLNGTFSGGSSYHILKMTNTPFATIIDGFTFEGGNSLSGTNPHGPAIWATNSSGLIRNCTFQANIGQKGGAIFFSDCPQGRVINCTFEANQAFTSGGAIFAKDSEVTIKRCRFNNNTNSSYYGENSLASIDNALFYGHFTGAEATCVLLDSTSSATIRWCTFANNLGSDIGTGVIGTQASAGDQIVDVINSIFWANFDGAVEKAHFFGPTENFNVRKSIVDGGFPSGVNIFNEDPLFDDNLPDPYQLSTCSPALDIATELDDTPLLDINSKLRTQGVKPDLGAYEYLFPFSLDGYGGDDTTAVCAGSSQLLTFDLQQRDTMFTEWDGANTYHGIMFDIRPKIPILLRDVLVHHDCSANPRHFVFWKEGSYQGSENTQADWTSFNYGNGTVTGCGVGDTAAMAGSFGAPAILLPNKKYALYVSVNDNPAGSPNLTRTHNDPVAGFGDEYLETDHITFFHGRGISDDFFGPASPFSQIFEGGLIYQVYDSIKWESGGNFISDNPNVLVSPSSDTTFRVKMWSVNGCTYTDKVFLEHTVIPENDLCVNATQLYPAGGFTTGSTVCASSGTNSTDCNFDIGSTVWYKFRAPASGRMDIQVKDIVPVNKSRYNLQMDIYEGPCSSLAFKYCEFFNPFVLDDVRYELINLTEGTMYFIRIDGVADQEGTFKLRIKDPCDEVLDDRIPLPVDTFVCQNTSFDLSTGGTLTETLVAPNMNGDTSDAIYFDVEALDDIRIDYIKCHFTAAINFPIDLYYRIGGHVGYESNASEWTFAGEFLVSPVGGNDQLGQLGEDLNIILKEGERVGFYIYPSLSVIHRQANLPHLSEATSTEHMRLYRGYAGVGNIAFLHSIKTDPMGFEGEVHATLIDEINWYDQEAQFSNDMDVSVAPMDSTIIVYELNHANGCIVKDTFDINVQDLVVKNTLDDGPNSLRNVIGCMQDDDMATFSTTLMNDTIRLTTGQITLDLEEAAIQGLGAQNLAISGESNKRIFRNQVSSNMTISDLSLINGKASITDGGGAIKNVGFLELKNCIISDNQSTLDGGAIWNDRTLLLDNVSFRRNQALGAGDHIFNTGPLGQMRVSNTVNVRNE